MASRAATKDPRKAQYHEHHPMRVDGVMPHDMDGDGFIEFQILQAMTEEGYWLSVTERTGAGRGLGGARPPNRHCQAD